MDTRNIPTELTLITEELCRVIASARRWQTCKEAWRAMLNARRIAESCIADVERICAKSRQDSCAQHESGQHEIGEGESEQ